MLLSMLDITILTIAICVWLTLKCLAKPLKNVSTQAVSDSTTSVKAKMYRMNKY